MPTDSPDREARIAEYQERFARQRTLRKVACAAGDTDEMKQIDRTILNLVRQVMMQGITMEEVQGKSPQT